MITEQNSIRLRRALSAFS